MSGRFYFCWIEWSNFSHAPLPRSQANLEFFENDYLLCFFLPPVKAVAHMSWKKLAMTLSHFFTSCFPFVHFFSTFYWIRLAWIRVPITHIFPVGLLWSPSFGWWLAFTSEWATWLNRWKLQITTEKFKRYHFFRMIWIIILCDMFFVCFFKIIFVFKMSINFRIIEIIHYYCMIYIDLQYLRFCTS